MAKLDSMKLRPTDTASVMRLLSLSKQPAFIWGPPGIGKSQLAQEIANEMGIAFIDIRLSQMDPTDVRGMPYKVEEGGVTTGVAWSPPLAFPRDMDDSFVRDIPASDTILSFAKSNMRGSNGIPYITNPVVTVEALDPDLTAELVDIDADELAERKAEDPYFGSDRFTVRLVDADGNKRPGQVKYTVRGKAKGLMGFEEMNSAPPSVLAACYQIVLDRRCGEYVVPDGVVMFAMGNREDDRGVAFKMPTPLLNRFIHVEMEHNHEDWIEWAVKNRVNSAVVGFISAFPDKLFQFNAKTASRAFATPRSWTFVSDTLAAIDKQGASKIVLMATITGSVGDAAAATFLEYLKIAEALPRPEDVLAGRVTKLNADDSNRVALSYHLTTSLLYMLSEENEELNNAGLDKKSKDKRRVEWCDKMNNWLKFSMDNFKPEVCVMGVGMAMKDHYGLPFNRDIVPCFDEFMKKYSKLLSNT